MMTLMQTLGISLSAVITLKATIQNKLSNLGEYLFKGNICGGVPL